MFCVTKEFENMLYLFSCAAQNIAPDINRSYDIPLIKKYAVDNRVWPVIVIGAQKWENDNLKISDSAVALDVYHNLLRTVKLAEVIKKLENNGISCCILKGQTLAKLYAEPFSRISSDIDIYIDIQDEKKSCKILAENGFEILERAFGSHHIKCISEVYGRIELHTEYFDKVIAELWFSDLGCFSNQKIQFDFENIQCSTLNITEGLIFNFLHFIKHYISGLVTVRQLMDNLLYLKAYKNEINYEKLNYILNKLQYHKFLLICIGFGIKYFHFNEADFVYEVPKEYNSLIFNLAEDFLVSAGNNDSTLYHEYGKTKYISKHKKGFYRIYHFAKNSGDMRKNVVASNKIMKEKYPILNRYPLLYPFCFLMRATVGVWKVFFSKNHASRKENKRLKLIKDFGL